MITSSPDFDSINQKCYDNRSNVWDRFPFEDILPELIWKYYNPHLGKKVLDIGSGTGVLAKWLMDQNLDLLCLDPSPVMVQRSSAKGLPTLQTTLQDYEPKDQFALVLAILSLIHVSKNEFSKQIKKIASALPQGGIFILAMIEGDSEGLEEMETGYPRFFAKYTKSEILQKLNQLFDLVDYRECRGSTNYLIFVFKKS